MAWGRQRETESLRATFFQPREGGARLSLRGKKQTFVTPTETKFHGDALGFSNGSPCTSNVGGWWLVVGSGWQRLAVGVGCPWGLSSTKKISFLRTGEGQHLTHPRIQKFLLGGIGQAPILVPQLHPAFHSQSPPVCC